MIEIRPKRFLGVVTGLGLLAVVIGCQPRSTPAGPGMLTSSGSGISFTYLKWDQGLRILLVDNVAGGHGSSSSGSTNDPVHRSKGYAGPDGSGYKWEVDSTNGTSATLKIDGKEYDLANGALFVVKAKEGNVEVHQLKRDLSAIPYDGAGCREAIEKDAEIRKLLGLEAPK
jgi:hypothetical protein